MSMILTKTSLSTKTTFSQKLSETENNVLRFWKDTISQFWFLYGIQQRNVSDHSNVICLLRMA